MMTGALQQRFRNNSFIWLIFIRYRVVFHGGENRMGFFDGKIKNGALEDPIFRDFGVR